MTGPQRRDAQHRDLPDLPGAADLAVPAAVADHRRLGLQDSLWSLVMVYPTFTIPFCTWLLMGFFKAVPREIEEAAIVDGCSLFGAFIKMAIPLSLPAILTVVIFAFTLTMQEFVYALTFISSSTRSRSRWAWRPIWCAATSFSGAS